MFNRWKWTTEIWNLIPVCTLAMPNCCTRMTNALRVKFYKLCNVSLHWCSKNCELSISISIEICTVYNSVIVLNTLYIPMSDWISCIAIVMHHNLFSTFFSHNYFDIPSIYQCMLNHVRYLTSFPFKYLLRS